jgi:hypothetical protein
MRRHRRPRATWPQRPLLALDSLLIEIGPICMCNPLHACCTGSRIHDMQFPVLVRALALLPLRGEWEGEAVPPGACFALTLYIPPSQSCTLQGMSLAAGGRVAAK